MSGNSEIIYYLKEFRKRALYCVILLFLLFALFIYFANDLYTLLALPLLNHLTAKQNLIATNVISPFFVPFELSFFAALFTAIPFFLYQNSLPAGLYFVKRYRE